MNRCCIRKIRPLPRILVTLNLGLNESDDPVIAIEKGGWHAAEGLIIARYMMFTQVYLQHTRFAFDHHIRGNACGAVGHLAPRCQRFLLPIVTKV